MIKFKHRGSFQRTESFLDRLKSLNFVWLLHDYGQKGVEALSAATPIDSGATAQAWSYRIEKKSGGYAIYWSNDNVNDGAHIAILLQYGHGNGSGAYIQGRDYINPAMELVFNNAATRLWEEVSKL